MNTRSLLILTITLGAIALGLTLWDQTSAQRMQNWNLPSDRSLVSESVLQETRAIQIHDGDKTVTLTPDSSGQWTVKEANGMRLDASRFKSLVSFLSEGKLERFITDKSEKFEPLGIGRHKLEFKGDDGNTLAELAIGDTAQVGGIFIRRNQEEAIYRTGESLTLQYDPFDWVDKKLFQGTPEKVKKVSISGFPEDSTTVIASRSEEEGKTDFVIDPLIVGFDLESSTLDSALRSLLNSRFTKTVEAAEIESFKGEAITYHLTFDDGSTVIAKVVQKPKPPEEETEDTEAKPASVPQSSTEPVYLWFEGNDSDQLTHPVQEQWVYEISNYTFNNLKKSPLIAAPAVPTPEATP